MGSLFLRHRRWRQLAVTDVAIGDTADIGDCGDGITPQICNRVTHPRDMSIFFRPGQTVD